MTKHALLRQCARFASYIPMAFGCRPANGEGDELEERCDLLLSSHPNGRYCSNQAGIHPVPGQRSPSSPASLRSGISLVHADSLPLYAAA